jgi:hypothetical protein
MIEVLLVDFLILVTIEIVILVLQFQECHQEAISEIEIGIDSEIQDEVMEEVNPCDTCD